MNIFPVSSVSASAATSWPSRVQADQEGLGARRGQGADGGENAENKGKSGELTTEQQAEVEKLQKIDREVRQHEMAHLAAGAGMVTSGASYTYTRGPDGQNYAVAGEVSIDTSPGRTPQETIARAERIQAAALAPADPSPQDRTVAAQAAQMAAQARQEMARMEDEGGNAVPGGADKPADNPGITAYQSQAAQESAGSRAAPGAAARIDVYG